MNALTWDIGIGAAAAILLAYSLLIRRHKALATLVSTYIAYFVATAWGERIAGFFSGDRVISNVWIRANATPYAIEIGLLIIFMFLLSSFIKLGGRRSRYGMLEIVAYTVSTIALLMMFMLLLMPDGMRETALATSKILPWVYAWREWILLIPIIIMIFFGIYGDEDY